MKYFTPDLHRRSRSGDVSIVDAALLEWMDRCEEYKSYLEKRYAELKEGEHSVTIEAVKSLMALHDWKLAAQGLGYTSGDFVIVVVGFGRAVNLLYSAEGNKVKAIQHNDMDSGNKDVYWLYDEFDLDDENRFTHSILFTNGLELQITFEYFFWETLSPVGRE